MISASKKQCKALSSKYLQWLAGCRLVLLLAFRLEPTEQPTDLPTNRPTGRLRLTHNARAEVVRGLDKGEAAPHVTELGRLHQDLRLELLQEAVAALSALVARS